MSEQVAKMSRRNPHDARRLSTRRINNDKKKPSLSSAHLVYRQVPIIEVLTKNVNDVKLRRQILDLSPASVKALSSIAKNALVGSLPLKSNKQRLVIDKYRPALNSLASNSSVKKKKEVLKQTGGFFPALASLVPIAISLVSSLVGSGNAKGKV